MLAGERSGLILQKTGSKCELLLKCHRQILAFQYCQMSTWTIRGMKIVSNDCTLWMVYKSATSLPDSCRITPFGIVFYNFILHVKLCNLHNMRFYFNV
jgi:hypothetical protein